MPIPHLVPRSGCPACGTTGGEQLFARPYSEPRLRTALTEFYALVGALDYSVLIDAEFVLARCTDCGLIFQVNVPNEALLGRLYEEWIDPAQAFARFHRDQPPHRSAELGWEVRIAASLLGSSAPRVALDYGCGWGEWSAATQRCNFTAWGTELSATRRAQAEKSGVRVVTDDALLEQAFGLINLDQVLEHVPEPRATLALLAAKLHPGGILRVGVPNGIRIGHALRRFDHELAQPRLGGLNPIAPLEHLNCFTTRSLVRLAAACGLCRVRPSWSALVRQPVWPPGVKAKLKSLVRPAYLRSGFTTQLYFQRIARGKPAH